MERANAAGKRLDVEAWRRQLYDDAAFYISEGNMTWTEFWNTPKRRLRRFGEALNRHWEQQRQAAERKSR